MASDSDYFTKLQTNIAKGISYSKSGEVQTYINEAQKAQKAYNKILKGGTDKTYGTDSQAAMDAYKNYTQKAMESAKSIQEAIKEYYSTMKEWMSSLKEDFNVDEFFNTYSTLKTAIKSIEKYSKFAQDKYNNMNKYLEIYEPIHELLAIEREASSHPDKITKKYIDDLFEKTVIIGDSLQNGFIVMICDGNNDGVYYYDDSYYFDESNDENNVYIISNNFTEFLDMIVKGA